MGAPKKSKRKLKGQRTFYLDWETNRKIEGLTRLLETKSESETIRQSIDEMAERYGIGQGNEGG